MKENKMKIMCKWCKVSIFCHIVSEEVSDHHGAYRKIVSRCLKLKSTSITKEKIIVKAQIEQLLHLR